MCWPPAGQLRAGKTAHLATPDTLAPQVIPHLQAAMQALRRAAPVRAWLVDPGQDLRQRRVPHGPLRRRPGPARRVRPRGDRDAVRSQGTADRHDPKRSRWASMNAQIGGAAGRAPARKTCRCRENDRPLQLGHRPKTAVTNGHPRAARTASDLGTRRLTPCTKRPSKPWKSLVGCRSGRKFGGGRCPLTPTGAGKILPLRVGRRGVRDTPAHPPDNPALPPAHATAQARVRFRAPAGD